MSERACTQTLSSRHALLQFLPPGGIVVEVGVAQGKFSQQIVDVCRPDKLYLVDSYEEDDPNKPGTPADKQIAVEALGNHPRVEFIFDRSVAAASRFPDRSLDWVYIDAMHGYPHVISDMRAWWPKIKPLGYMAGHDYLTQPPLFEVERAVDDFVRARGLRLAVVTSEELWKNWAVQKPSM